MEKHGLGYRSDVVARIVRSTDGGPLRQMVKGRSTKPTGTFVSIKAGSRAMPWESMKCELPVLELAEVSSAVVDLLAQPHRLELYLCGKRRPWIYFPDLELTVEPALRSSLIKKVPFAQALLDWRPGKQRNGACRKIVVEIKDDQDPRNDDPDYQAKLRLAASVYRKIGIDFVTVMRSRDIECVNLRLVHSMALDRYTAVSNVDIDRSIRYLSASGGIGTYGGLIEELGGGSLGRARAAALHVRRIVSVSVGWNLDADTAVSLFRSDRMHAGSPA